MPDHTETTTEVRRERVALIAMTHLEMAHASGDSRLVGYLVRAIRPLLDVPQAQEATQTTLFPLPASADVVDLPSYMTGRAG